VLANLNRVTITGYLVRDPTLRSLPAQRTVGDLRIACHRRNQEGPGGTWVQWVDYCDVRVYGSFAQSVCQRLRAGSSVAIEGHLSSQPTYCENPEHKRGMFVLAKKIQLLPPRLDVSPRSGAPLGIDAPLDAPLRIDAPLGIDAPLRIDAPKRRARFSYGSIDAS
jgi:single stranded DNA-binding protein